MAGAFLTGAAFLAEAFFAATFFLAGAFLAAYFFLAGAFFFAAFLVAMLFSTFPNSDYESSMCPGVPHPYRLSGSTSHGHSINP